MTVRRGLSLCILIMLLLVACSSQDDAQIESTEQNSKQENVQSTESNSEDANKSEEATKGEIKGLDGIVNAFREAGMEVGENETIAYEIIGANDGRKFKLNGHLIEIYYYDPSNLTEQGKEIIESARTNGTIEFSGFPPVNCVVNGDFILLRHEEHPDKDKIIEIFSGLDL